MKRISLFGVVLAISTVHGLASADPAACADAAEKAQLVRDQGKLVEARELFVACAQMECPKVVRDSCSEWLADVERRVPKIVVNARDAKGRDLEVRATIDGAALPASVSVSGVRVDPGRHQIRVEALGDTPYPAKDEVVILREAEGVRVLSMTFGSNEPAAPVSRAEQESTKPSVWTWVFGGTAIAGFGVFTAFGLMGISEYRALESDCSPRCSRDRIDGVRDRFVVADIGLVVGLLAAGGTALTLLWGGSGAKTASGR